jgi:predicted glycosyltransferase
MSLLSFQPSGPTTSPHNRPAQPLRAARLHALGLAHVLPESDLSPQGMATAIASTLAAPPPPRNTLDLNGADHAADLISNLA